MLRGDAAAAIWRDDQGAMASGGDVIMAAGGIEAESGCTDAAIAAVKPA